MSDDAVAATLAALNQQVKALVAVLKDINANLKGEADDDRGSSDAPASSG